MMKVAELLLVTACTTSVALFSHAFATEELWIRLI